MSLFLPVSLLKSLTLRIVCDTDIRTVLANRMNSDSFLYVYFCDEMDNESIKSCDDLILDGSSCKRGTIYRFNKVRMGLEKSN